jgi:hypothetical protein
LHALDGFCNWLSLTALSQSIQSTAWLIPALQTVHILAIAVVIACALMVDLRLMGVGAIDQTIAAVARRFLPFLWASLPVLLVTGAALIIAEPARALENPVFALKMACLLAASALTLACQIALAAKPVAWERSGGGRMVARLVALTSLMLWVAIIFAGRWIAYVQTG